MMACDFSGKICAKFGKARLAKSATARDFSLYCLIFKHFFRPEHAASVSRACKVIGKSPGVSAHRQVAQVLLMNF